MKLATAAMGAILLAVSGPATAQQVRAELNSSVEITDTLVIIPGEKITFELRPDGRISIVTRAAGAPTPAAQRQINTAAPGQMIATLSWDDADGTVLKVESGMDYGLQYNAAMMLQINGVAGLRAAPVCTMTSKAVVFETWAQPVNVMTISNFKRKDGEQVCPDPETAPYDPLANI